MMKTFRRRLGPALVAALLTGCGAQDLYEPPDAPITEIGRLALPSQSKGVDVLGDYAYVAGGQAGLHIIDISDPSNPRLVKTLDTVKYAESVQVASTASAGGVVDIAFVVEGTEGLTTYDITNPEAAYSFDQGTTAVDGDAIFVELRDDPNEPYTVYLAESWKGIRIFEAEPAIPGLLRYEGVYASTGGYARAVAVKDGFAYVADDEMGLAVMDVRDRTLGAVGLISRCDTAGEAEDVAVVGNHLYLADLDNGLVVMEVRMEGTPPEPHAHVVGHAPLPGKCEALVVRDGRVYIAAGDAGVQVVDVSNPSAPVSLGRVLTTDCTDVAISKNGLVVASDDYDGFIVFDHGAPFSDAIAPAAVSDLAATGLNMSTIRLEWSAPGDDRLSGTAAQYDIRWSPAAITTEAEWDAATAIDGEPTPEPRGTEESLDVGGLDADVTYHFAMKTADAAGNWSALSNGTSATPPSGNVPPTLVPDGVAPIGAIVGSFFTYQVIYTDADGDVPTEATVVVDGTPYAMSWSSGTPENGAAYRYEIAGLTVGTHEFYFRFSDGHNPAVTSPPTEGPYVGERLVTMGSPVEELGRDDDETQHLVVFTYEFEISLDEVRQDNYEFLMGTNPSRFVAADAPVERVTWFDAVAYCNARSAYEGLTPAYTINGADVTWNRAANGWRLPTEAEWEWAARAGTETALPGGDLTEQACAIDPVLDAYGWYCGNADSTQAVRGKQPNAGNFFDMHGNVWEWCWDWYTEDLGSAVAVDPEGPGGGAQRVVRGGSWYYYARECRSASRSPYWPNSADDTVGFRVARTLP